jgi:hypothetical protein
MKYRCLEEWESKTNLIPAATASTRHRPRRKSNTDSINVKIIAASNTNVE